MKRKIKNLFKDITIFHYIVIFTVLLVLIIFTLLSHLQNKDNESKLGKIKVLQEHNIEKDLSNLNKTVYYSEGDEDGAYNYIVNGSDLLNNNSEMPYYYYSEINDVLNDELKSAGYSSRKLTFITGSMTGTKYQATFSISDCNDTVTISNNMGLSDYSVVINLTK